MDNRKTTTSIKDKIKDPLTEAFQFTVGVTIIAFAIMVMAFLLSGCKVRSIYNEYEIEVFYEDGYRDTIFVVSQTDPVLAFDGDKGLIITREDIIEGDIRKIKIISVNGK